MGRTRITTLVFNLLKDRSPCEADFLVDTGAVDCLVARDRLSQAGVSPEGKAVYELADGRPGELEYGFARIVFMGEENVGRVIFGADGVEPILGVIALGAAGIVVDPRTQTPKRLHARPLK
jgi:clan AA aspartic protease